MLADKGYVHVSFSLREMMYKAMPLETPLLLSRVGHLRGKYELAGFVIKYLNGVEYGLKKV